MVEKLQVYIGTEPNFWLPTEVLRYSILSRTKSPVEFIEINEVPSKKFISPYSGLKRFYVPQINQYKSKALYLNSGALVLTDIAELFALDTQQHAALARPKLAGVPGFFTSVMLLDCPRLSWSGDEIIEKTVTSDLYNRTVWGMTGGLVTSDLGPLPDDYNQFDQFTPDTRIFLYTDLSIAPWKNRKHPQADLFIQELKKAIEDKEIPRAVVEKEIARQIVDPDILL